MLNWGCRHSRPTRSHRHHNHNHHHHHHLTLGLKCSSRDHQAFHLLLPSSTPASTSSPTATLCCSGGGEEAREQVPSQETESSTFFNRSTHLVSHSLLDFELQTAGLCIFSLFDKTLYSLHSRLIQFLPSHCIGDDH